MLLGSFLSLIAFPLSCLRLSFALTAVRQVRRSIGVGEVCDSGCPPRWISGIAFSFKIEIKVRF